MPEDLRQRLLVEIAHREPRRTAEVALGLLMAATEATGGGLFVVASGQRPWLACSRSLNQHALDRVATEWRRHRQTLLRSPLIEDAAAVVLVEETALVYLEGMRLADVARAVGNLSAILGRVARELADHPQGSNPLEDYLERTPTEQIERQRLMTLLERNEWNLSRVARIIGVTRVTIYAKLRRYGIARLPRVRVGPPRRQAPNES